MSTAIEAYSALSLSGYIGATIGFLFHFPAKQSTRRPGVPQSLNPLFFYGTIAAHGYQIRRF